MIKLFSDSAWNDYTSWLDKDKRILKKINILLKDIDRNGYEGIGKPKQLRNELSGYWSRRIDYEHRIVYRIHEEKIYIISCKGHYDD